MPPDIKKLPIHPDAVTAFEDLKSQALSSRLKLKRKGLVFYRGIAKMPRFLEDLKAAGIPEFDELGGGSSFTDSVGLGLLF